jgi:hypothetical protein
MRRFARENGLSLFFAAIFLAALAGQSFAGQRNYNAEQLEHGQQTLSWWHYLVTPDFGGAVLENWQSEFLQFSLFIAATVWLVQKGSNESKKLADDGLESNEQQEIGPNAPLRAPLWAKPDDIRTRIYENSLLIVMTLIFVATWFGQSLNNWRVFNQEQATHDAQRVSWGRYLLAPDFWEKTLQNWQSEFLAVGTLVVFTIYLRQRGSAESKPVGAPHDETASSG